MTYRTPLRLTIRHFAQRLRMDGATFITSSFFPCTAKMRIILASLASVQFSICFRSLRNSQDERVAFGDCHRVFLVGSQGTVSRDNCPPIG
jgi:hypothetical protein